MEDPFVLFEPRRLAIGGEPWPFLLEVALRTSCTYAVLMLAMRLLGRRVAGQATVFEISVVVALAASIGAPLQDAKRGLLPPLVAVLGAVALHRGLGALAARFPRWDRLTSGHPVVLLRAGVLDRDAQKTVALSNHRLFAMLRGKGIQHLGELESVVLESDGELSLVSADPARPGLSILPEVDSALRFENSVDGLACARCGARSHAHVSCTHCGNTEHVPRVERLAS